MGPKIDITEHMGLLYWFVKRQAGKRGLDWQDILGPCYQGLVRAAERFDSSRGQFTTCACLWMFQFLMRSLEADYGRRPMAQLLGEGVSFDDEHPMETHELVEKALGPLDNQERLVLVRACEHRGAMAAVGRDLGISRSRVQQIQAGALKKSRRALELAVA